MTLKETYCVARNCSTTWFQNKMIEFHFKLLGVYIVQQNLNLKSI